jgi:hypothetical protein
MKKENTYEKAGIIYREACPEKLQKTFNHMVSEAQKVGMKVNKKKTKIMCISAAVSYEARVRLVVDSEGNIAENVDQMKVLGVTLDRRLDFQAHVLNVVRNIRARLWSIKELSRAGFDQEELLRVYKSLIRPAAEYAVAAWSSMITCEQSSLIEKQQTLALKLIYGFQYSERKLLELSGLETLEERRRNYIGRFAAKASENPRYGRWFPQRVNATYERRQSITYNKYVEMNCKTQRCFDSPLYVMRRMLNGENEKKTSMLCPT